MLFLASSFQEAVYDSILIKIKKAINQIGINKIVVVGGVTANRRLRDLIRKFARKQSIRIFFPTYKKYCTDNAAMIGVAANFKVKMGILIKDLNKFDRVPRLEL